MKIYYTSSTAEYNKHKKNYNHIRDFLIQNKHILTRDWIPHTEKDIETGQTDLKPKIKDIYKACIKAIGEAELVIIEDTVSNFSTGHQITVALQQRKPTLVLWQGKKHRQFNQTFIHGIESHILEIAEYTDNNLEEILTHFINKYQGLRVRNRFHLVLNEVERQYLDWAQFNRGKSRTRVIRDSLNKELKNDQEYNNFLKGEASEKEIV